MVAECGGPEGIDFEVPVILTLEIAGPEHLHHESLDFWVMERPGSSWERVS